MWYSYLDISHCGPLWIIRIVVFNVDKHDDDVDDVQHKKGEADTKSRVVKDARHSGVFLCYLLMSRHVGIFSL